MVRGSWPSGANDTNNTRGTHLCSSRVYTQTSSISRIGHLQVVGSPTRSPRPSAVNKRCEAHATCKLSDAKWAQRMIIIFTVDMLRVRINSKKRIHTHSRPPVLLLTVSNIHIDCGPTNVYATNGRIHPPQPNFVVHWVNSSKHRNASKCRV